MISNTKKMLVCLLTKFIILELFDEVTPTFTLIKPENVIIQVVLVYTIKYTLLSIHYSTWITSNILEAQK